MFVTFLSPIISKSIEKDALDDKETMMTDKVSNVSQHYERECNRVHFFNRIAKKKIYECIPLSVVADGADRKNNAGQTKKRGGRKKKNKVTLSDTNSYKYVNTLYNCFDTQLHHCSVSN